MAATLNGRNVIASGCYVVFEGDTVSPDSEVPLMVVAHRASAGNGEPNMNALPNPTGGVVVHLNNFTPGTHMGYSCSFDVNVTRNLRLDVTAHRVGELGGKGLFQIAFTLSDQ